MATHLSQPSAKHSHTGTAQSSPVKSAAKAAAVLTPVMLNQAITEPDRVSPMAILQLQRLAGNRAVTGLLQARPVLKKPPLNSQTRAEGLQAQTDETGQSLTIRSLKVGDSLEEPSNTMLQPQRVVDPTRLTIQRKAATPADKKKVNDWIDDQAAKLTTWATGGSRSAYLTANPTATDAITTWQTDAKAAVTGAAEVADLTAARRTWSTNLEKLKATLSAKVNAWTWIVEHKKELDDWKVQTKPAAYFTANPETVSGTWETGAKAAINTPATAEAVNAALKTQETEFNKMKATLSAKANAWNWIVEHKKELDAWKGQAKPAAYFTANPETASGTWETGAKAAINTPATAEAVNAALKTQETEFNKMKGLLSAKVNAWNWIVEHKKELDDWKGQTKPAAYFTANPETASGTWETGAKAAINTAATAEAVNAALKTQETEFNKMKGLLLAKFKAWEWINAEETSFKAWTQGSPGRKTYFSAHPATAAIETWRDGARTDVESAADEPTVQSARQTQAAALKTLRADKLKEYQDSKRAEFESSITTSGKYAMLPTLQAGDKGFLAGLKNVGKGFGKGLLATALGPLKYLLLINKEERLGERKEWFAKYGTSGKLAVLLKRLNQITKVIGEIGAFAGWASLICAIIGAATSAAAGAGAFFAAAAPILGVISLACAMWVLLMKGILLAKNAVRLRRYAPGTKGRAMIVAQMWRDGGSALGSLLSVIAGGFVDVSGVGAFLKGPSELIKPETSIANVFKQFGAGYAFSGTSDIAGGVTGYKADVQRKPLPGAPPLNLQSVIMRQGEEQAPGKEQIAPEELAEALEVVTGVAGVGHESQTQNQTQLQELGETQEAVTETLTTYNEKMKPLDQLEDQLGQAQQATDRAEPSLDQVDRPDQEKDEEMAAAAEEKTTQAEQAANRDPAEIKEAEVKKAITEAQTAATTVPPKKKKGFFHRLGLALLKLFTNIKNRLKKLAQLIRRKLVELVLKASGADEPMAEFEQELNTAKTDIPEGMKAVEEQQAVTLSTTQLAEQAVQIIKKAQ